MEALLKTSRVLWSALLTASLLFCTASLLPLQGVLQVGEVPFVVAPALAAVAVLDTIMSFVLPAHTFGVWARTTLQSEVTLERDTTADVLYRQLAPEIRVLRIDAPKLRLIHARWQSSLVLSCALSESVALMGAVLSVLGYWPLWSAPLGVAGVILVAIRRPSRASLLRQVEKAVGAKAIVT
jgi:hypothetical protein